MDDLVIASDMKTIVPGTTDQFWATKRHLGGGPVYVKIGVKVYYRRTDVEAWLNSNRYTRTDQPLSAALQP